LTADQTVRDVIGLGPGETLLVHGAGGVTGRLVVQMAVELGAHVIATASSRGARRGGRSGGVDYRLPDWKAAAGDRTRGAGVDAAVNAVPGDAEAIEELVRDGGRLATLTSDPPSSERSVRAEAVYVAPDGGRLQRLVGSLAEGGLQMAVGRSSMTLRAAGEALTVVGAGEAFTLRVG
jgi:NADPH:quinone reductase-like Zn-dependent oxidoreductase